MDASLKLKAEQLAGEIASQAKTLDDVNVLFRTLMKSALERMLNTEMDVHLGRKSPAAVPADDTPIATSTRPANRRVEVSPTHVSEITADVEVTAWRQRRLDAVWPIVYLDGIVVHVRGEYARVSQHTMYMAIGVNLQGKKELLGLWLSETEGAKFWLS